MYGIENFDLLMGRGSKFDLSTGFRSVDLLIAFNLMMGVKSLNCRRGFRVLIYRRGSEFQFVDGVGLVDPGSEF